MKNAETRAFNHLFLLEKLYTLQNVIETTINNASALILDFQDILCNFMIMI